MTGNDGMHIDSLRWLVSGPLARITHTDKFLDILPHPIPSEPVPESRQSPFNPKMSSHDRFVMLADELHP